MCGGAGERRRVHAANWAATNRARARLHGEQVPGLAAAAVPSQQIAREERTTGRVSNHPLLRQQAATQ